ncbi:carboxypeptidase-like regulatory domain-containing protein [Ferruginibacter sp.]
MPVITAIYPKNKTILLKRLAVTFLFFFLFVTAGAQKITVSGRITDETGAPVAFATVQLKSSKIGWSVTADGKFTAKIPYASSTLIFYATGFSTIERTITEKEIKDSAVNIVVVMKRSAEELKEVVVTGYGTARKMEYSSASASVSSMGLVRRDVAVTSGADFRLKGKASGVIVSPGYTTEKSAIGGEMNKTPSSQSKLLTAGEVNDFKKWKMWEDYNENEFKAHSDKWGLYATQRYSIQLQNNDFKAVVGQTVYLISKKNGDTLWTAVTDNTGKAELWNGFSSIVTDKDVFIAVKNEPKQYPAVAFTQGLNRAIINQSCAVSNKVQIAFVVDATGSMQDEISYLKDELEDVLKRSVSKDPSLELHTGAVFYRDKTDAYVTRMQPFTKGISETVNFIKQQNADGGGDYPEALKEALQVATQQLQWSADARTRIIFLLMDAPPHDEAKIEMAQLITDAAAKGIRIVPVACSGTDKATEFIMRSIALATNGTYLFLTDDSGIGNSHIKPTTDEFKVELLNDLMQRVIEQMCYVNTCEQKVKDSVPVAVYTNTEKVKVYPNPTNGPVTLKTDKDLQEIYVADFTGKVLMRMEAKDKKGTFSIDLSAFPSATYFIRYITKDNTAGAEKVVLVR